MAAELKPLLLDETGKEMRDSIIAISNAIKNTDTVQKAKEEIQAEGATQVANVKAASEEIIGKVEQIDQNTQRIDALKSDLTRSLDLKDWDLSKHANIVENQWFSDANGTTAQAGNQFMCKDMPVIAGHSYYFYCEKVAAGSGSDGYNNLYSARQVAFHDSENNIIAIDLSAPISPMVAPKNAAKMTIVFQYKDYLTKEKGVYWVTEKEQDEHYSSSDSIDRLSHDVRENIDKLNSVFDENIWNLLDVDGVVYREHSCFSDAQGTLSHNYARTVILNIPVNPNTEYYFYNEAVASNFSADGYDDKPCARKIAWYRADRSLISVTDDYVKSPIISPSDACFAGFDIQYKKYSSDQSVTYFEYGENWFTPNDKDNHINGYPIKEIINIQERLSETDNIVSGYGRTIYRVNHETGNYMHPRRPTICFTLDGDYDLNPTMEAVMSKHDHRMCFAVRYVSFNDDAIDVVAKYKAWEEKGHEIALHSNYYLYHPYTDDEIISIIKDCYATGKKYGFDIHGLVGSSGYVGEKFLPIVKQRFDYCASVNNHSGSLDGNLSIPCHDFLTSNPYKLWRYSMQTSTLEQQKAAVDDCIANNRLLMFYGHAQSKNNDNFTAENLDLLLTYIDEKTATYDCVVKTPYEAIKDFYSIRYDDVIGLLN